jgi:hypothetical protein
MKDEDQKTEPQKQEKPLDDEEEIAAAVELCYGLRVVGIDPKRSFPLHETYSFDDVISTSLTAATLDNSQTNSGSMRKPFFFAALKVGANRYQSLRVAMNLSRLQT